MPSCSNRPLDPPVRRPWRRTRSTPRTSPNAEPAETRSPIPFFGWLTATGTSVVLTGLLLAVGNAVGLAAADDISDAQSQVGQNAGGFPQLPVSSDDATGAIIALVSP